MTYIKNKPAIMKWREANTDKYNKAMLAYQKDHYKERYETYGKTHAKNYYQWNKAVKTLLNILNNLYPL